MRRCNVEQILGVVFFVAVWTVIFRMERA